MENKLWTAMKKETNKSFTENGADTLKSTNSDVLDLFSMGGAFRNRSAEDIQQVISKALAEDKELGIKCLFYLRDVRGGQGERRVFREGLKVLSRYYKEDTTKLLKLIPEYGRWDDILSVENINIKDILLEQLLEDGLGEAPSLLAKWLPSENASSKRTKETGRALRKYLGFSSKEYREMLTTLRGKINLLETQMSSKKFSEIDYSKIPSKAGMNYRTAFNKQDGERYTKFLESVKKGEKTINTKTLFPYDLVRQARKDNSETLSVMWDKLPDYTKDDERAIVVADTSGSMTWENNGLAMDVSVSLAMYFAERNDGAFKNKFISFSNNPKMQEVRGNTLQQKIKNLDRTEWGGSTNIQKVLDLILNTAVSNDISEDEMPKTLYIVSDMEFDHCATGVTNFEMMESKYAETKYIMPNIVFWNVNSRQKNVPVTKNKKGVVLVSGCSPSIFKMVMEDTTPEKFMLSVLNSERYNKISELL